MLKLALLCALAAVALAVPTYEGHDDEYVEPQEQAHPAPEYTAPVSRPYGYPYVYPYIHGGYPYFYHPYYYGGYYPGYANHHPAYYHHHPMAPAPAPHVATPGVLTYIGPFKGTCYGAPDGLYYVDSASFAFCSNGIKTVQACAEGSANPALDFFHPGKLYHYGDFCSINLSDKTHH